MEEGDRLSHTGKTPANYECKVMVILISSGDGKNGSNKADILLSIWSLCYFLPFLRFSRKHYIIRNIPHVRSESPTSRRVIEIQYAYLAWQLGGESLRFISSFSFLFFSFLVFLDRKSRTQRIDFFLTIMDRNYSVCTMIR